ncbi:DNA processing protein DprA [Tepidimonas thermarum]|uniref:DNA processing protein DprA n=1 Tax=Tepidimonas thermarum TaxID=335431 RepID=A0A554X3X8_9BURK|nr:DNA-processing protein DprA [Tepidimonas thermarum]TSE30550.1 DNA processing protein DprA [Tepidimonas thermarum]
MAPDDWEDWLRLTATDGVGAVTARRLLAAFGLPAHIFAQPASALAEVVGPALAARLRATPAGWDALRQHTRQWLADPQHHLIALGDTRYPAPLLTTPDPPALLHVVGDAAALSAPRALAVVGSRNPTPQGAENARAFAQALAAEGVVIVSGLAAGIDAAAHEGALAAGGVTVAVVGTGVDRVYPARHRALAHRIAAAGCVVSEYPLGTPPLAPHFPRRNRLIAGLTQGTLVVEAALGSGSLITAELATHMGREVFAIPGSIHSPQSRGCHALIRQGAKLVETAEHIREELTGVWGPPALTAPAAAADGDAGTDPAEDPVLAALGHDPTPFDLLQARCGWDTPQLQAHLLALELKGVVQRLPGGRLQRVARA